MLKSVTILTASIFLISAAAIATAQSSGGEFEITKSTIDNGGGTSVGGFWANVSEFIFEDGFD